MTACCGCGPQSTLLVSSVPLRRAGVDDPSRRRMHVKFVERNRPSTTSTRRARYLGAHGKPIAFYSDKHDVFRVNGTGAVEDEGEGMARFGRSRHALDIDILGANTPKATSPVERLTRPCGIAWSSNCAFAGSAQLPPDDEPMPGFLTDYNARFGKEPKLQESASIIVGGDDLADVLAWREEPTVCSPL